jgi:hypothetical protein
MENEVLIQQNRGQQASTRCRLYPYEPLIDELHESLVRLGLQPFPLPMGIKLPQDYTQTEAPVMLENFDGFPDPTDSKADGQTMALRPALKNKNVTLLDASLCLKTTDGLSGKRVTTVHADSKRREDNFKCRL